MRLHALQYLRAIAALAVVYSHSVIQVADYEQHLVQAGSFGVDIFFVISGFIMIYISRPDDKPLAFFSNRVRRVVPLYWFFTFAMAAILLLMPNVFKATVFELKALLLSLSFIPFWSLVNPEEAWPLLAPGWSLNFEMYFYLIFAVSLLMAERFRIVFITSVITVVFIIATQNNDGDSALAAFFSLSMVFEFVFGMLLAVAWKRGLRLSHGVAVALLITGSCLLFLKLPVPRIFEYGVPSLLIVMGCLYVRVGHYPWAVLLGDASYALYLSHIFVLGVLRKIAPPFLGDGPFAAYAFVALSFVACTVVSVFVHRYIDQWLLHRDRIKPIQQRLFT